MPAFLKEAHTFRDTLTGKDCVELKYTKYIEGEGYVNLSECLDARPIGGWTDLKSSRESMRYEQFLDTMVEKTLITRRIIALIQLENILCENKNIHSLLRIMHTIKIIDPTFEPPIINIKCKWQKKLIKNICLYTLPNVIENCVNEKRLERLFNIMRLIESEI